MLLEEFSELTGFYPDPEFYQHIEQAYYDFGGTKQDFCRAYKENRDGLAESIAIAAAADRCQKEKDAERLLSDRNEEVRSLEEQITRLKNQLEREQEWRPYQNPHNVSEKEYLDIAGCGLNRELSDDEARELVSREFGFDKSRIRIVHEIAVEEINRHRQIRSRGSRQVSSFYGATDCNYARFDVCGLEYEMYNGCLLRFF